MFGLSYILRLVFTRAVRRTLARHNADVGPGFRNKLREAASAVPASPSLAEVGLPVRFLLELSRLNIACDRVLRTQGLADAVIETIIEDTNWHLIRPGIRFLKTWLVRLGKGPGEVTRVSVDLLWAHLFTSPFRKTDLEPGIHEETGRPLVSGCDVSACPLQTYYKSQNALHVCRSAACQQDYRMAQEWGVDFIRTRTLAAGNSHCDFRFVEKPVAETGSKAGGQQTEYGR